MKEKIDQLFENEAQLPKISSVVSKVMEMVNRPDVAIADLAKEISKDPGLTAAVIKLSNSAYYRPTKPVKTVQESLMTLGIKTVREMILLTEAKGILKKDLKGYQIDGESNWMHSLTVAELAMRITVQKKLKFDKDVAFTAGLLHNIGKVILSEFFPSIILQLRAELQTYEGPYKDLERKYFGYTHEEAGAKLLAKWNFPEELVEVANFYTEPEKAVKFPELVSVVHIAHCVVILSGMGIDIGGLRTPLSPQALKVAGVTDGDLQMYYTLLPEIARHLAELIAV
ncbi:HDIG domain protein [Leptospira inadai serovar Lyme str. 10]|uniref:HDIG domain protein n=2 Tax=Leptospira inadai serovar Lyme TaxID=293084 RepID=V6HHE9_9LEPT|nr:HDOD domain-containing protein [Leptospira inadai]EQA35790.1 HDIG domain protein [Leptospira inadai serovar Lyme str. 10]PNV76930.1 HD family phosphohydrolase [Leptospira inadai serovar Lyme]